MGEHSYTKFKFIYPVGSGRRPAQIPTRIRSELGPKNLQKSWLITSKFSFSKYK
jgi:hypothetical protein